MNNLFAGFLIFGSLISIGSTIYYLLAYKDDRIELKALMVSMSIMIVIMTPLTVLDIMKRNELTENSICENNLNYLDSVETDLEKTERINQLLLNSNGFFGKGRWYDEFQSMKD